MSDIEVRTNNIEEVQGTEVVVENNNTAAIETESSIEVEGYKKEFTVVGDALFATVNSNDVPAWLSDLLNRVISTYVDGRLISLEQLNAALQIAIDEIQVAKNTYVSQVNIQQTVENAIVSYLATLNASIANNSANIVDIKNTYATKDYAQSLIATSIDASVQNGSINSALTNIQTTLSDSIQTLAQSIETLNSNFTSTETNLALTANAVEKLYTYTGVDTNGNPTGTGLLADLQILQKQQDGVIETYIGTYDVITYQDIAPADGIPDPGTITLVTTAEPYSRWIPLEGSGPPTTTNEELYRVYKDITNLLFYMFTATGWVQITESEYIQNLTTLRTLHIGDTYIKYELVNGERNYLGAFKFIRTVVDTTAPYGTDTEGFTWSKITDTDSQNAFIAALQAKDLADSKRRVFTVQPYGEQDDGDLWISTEADGTQVVRVFIGGHRAFGFDPLEWVIADEQLQTFVDTVYTPETTSLKNQIDGKIEYIFVRGTDTFSLGDGIATELVDTYNQYSTLAKTIDELKNVPTKQELLNRIDVLVSITQEVREAFHGSVVYFADTTPAEAYWYYSQRGALDGVWRVVSDTSVYDALATAEKAQASADGVVVSFYGYECNTIPDTFTVQTEFPVLQYWYDTTSSTLKTLSATSWVAVTSAKEGDTLTTVVVEQVTTDENGNTVAPYFVKTDTKTYTFNGTNWVSATPNGLISESRKLLELDAFLKGPDGKYGSAGSTFDIYTQVKADDAYSQATSKFSYNSTISLPVTKPDGTTEIRELNSGFGIEASIDSNGVVKNEFLINAETLRFTNTNKTGIVTPFRIDTSGAIPDIVFKGKVTFANGQEGTIEEAIAAVSQSIVVGDKNINISDNLIPMTQFVLDANHADYVFSGTFSKYKSTTLDAYTEAIAKLDTTLSTLLSPYVDDMTESYYFRFAITGVTDLSGFSVVVFLDNTFLNFVELKLSYTDPNTGTVPTLDPTQWYEIDGLITPSNNPSTGSHGYIRDVTRRVVANVQNVAMPSQAQTLALGWTGPSEVARIKLAVITADTITSAAATEDLVQSLYSEQQIQIQQIDANVNDIIADNVLSPTEKRTLINDVQRIKEAKVSLVGIDSISGQADKVGIVNDTTSPYHVYYTDYVAAYDALIAYLDSLTYTDTDGVVVHWDTTTRSTPIDAAIFRSTFDTYLQAEQALLSAISYVLKDKADFTSAVLGNPENNNGTVTINNGVINADALALGKDLVDIGTTTWSPKPGMSGVFLNNESINIIVNGVTRVKIGRLDNNLPTDWRF